MIRKRPPSRSGLPQNRPLPQVADQRQPPAHRPHRAVHLGGDLVVAVPFELAHRDQAQLVIAELLEQVAELVRHLRRERRVGVRADDRVQGRVVQRLRRPPRCGFWGASRYLRAGRSPCAPVSISSTCHRSSRLARRRKPPLGRRLAEAVERAQRDVLLVGRPSRGGAQLVARQLDHAAGERSHSWAARRRRRPRSGRAATS